MMSHDVMSYQSSYPKQCYIIIIQVLVYWICLVALCRNLFVPPQDLTERLNLQSDEMVDEELVREHLLTVLKTWVYKCHDHICGIDREIELLENREKMMKDVARQPEAAPPPPRQPMKPIVITREMLKVCNARLEQSQHTFSHVQYISYQKSHWLKVM